MVDLQNKTQPKENTAKSNDKKIVHINERVVKEELGELVRQSVEDTLNAMLDEEAERICNAQKHERSPERTDYRAGYYQRGFETKGSTGQSRTTTYYVESLAG